MKQLRHLVTVNKYSNYHIQFMTVLTGVKITDEQRNFLEKKSINFSKFVRNAIDKEMMMEV